MERSRMQEEEHYNKGERVYEETGSVDWRGRPSNPNKHGGMRAAAFVLGLQGFEIMGIAAVGNNLISYVINEMHFSLSKSANTVTNFIGTVFILALFGGYLSDSYLSSFSTILIFAFLELSGFILLSLQAHLPQLKPPQCNMLSDSGDEQCVEAKGMQALIFFLALYLVALGSGCVKPNMIAHGAHQFNPNQSKKLSTYFNSAYFAFSMGELVALTLLVYVQTHSGMDVGFGVSAAAMAMGLISFISGAFLYKNKPPQGSILTPIAQVFVAATLKRKHVCPTDPVMSHGIYHKEPNCDEPISNSYENPHPTERFRHSVQQGSSMNSKLTETFQIPPASLQAIPYIMLIFIVPLYDILFVPFARKITSHESGITPLQRIGTGLFLATFSMISAALMEKKRRNAAVNENVTLSIFWITPQFLIFGISEMFTAVGLLEFFYKQPLKGMQSFLTAITYCSFSFGFFLSSVLVTLVNKASSDSSGAGWLSDNNLNKDKLDHFYWLLAVQLHQLPQLSLLGNMVF
ncbi:protein NRT1/ PTR FAMILY 4.3 [Sesamum angolense]|uniref:Protein NRT1/ PTR FAMILY 4.3 n=1 Tax=Sesamum angolense TaxID=2727404 RepID=A0AAE2C2S3_9LAMI|nr:protein NRT1/ PTR FAMILY 4.3 [Sesamum angolense]